MSTKFFNVYNFRVIYLPSSLLLYVHECAPSFCATTNNDNDNDNALTVGNIKTETDECVF